MMLYWLQREESNSGTAGSSEAHDPELRIVENHNFDFARPENRNLVHWGLFLI